MKKIFLFLILSTSAFSNPITFEQIKEAKPLKLHLGCGQQYFKGYVNIDFPLAEHTAQTKQVADYCADITSLNFTHNSVDEVRNHHVFEHFGRPVALAMLCAWQYWLKEGGTLQIETPDFAESIALFQKSFVSFETKQHILRHLFGSHEAAWAVHWDGWYKEKFVDVLKSLGFSRLKFKHIKTKSIMNIQVHAQKMKNLSIEDLRAKGKLLLKQSLIDNSESEMSIYHVWCKEFDTVFDTMIGVKYE